MSEEYRNFEHSRKKAIKTHCLECSGFSASERKQCQVRGCALWAFRNGYEVDENNQKVVNLNHVRTPGRFGGIIDSESIALDDDFELETDSDDEEV